MKNLAAIVTEEAIKQALDEALVKKPDLKRPTKFHLVYKNENFPPKEVVRMAARKMGIKNLGNYRLHGGKSTNQHLEKKGFKIVQFADWQANDPSQTILKKQDGNEMRIARMVYNENGWQYPSEWKGKSKSKDSYETQNGFGHEEWLLDTTKNIDGYHYGFLEPIHKNRSKYEGQIFDLFLFTVNSETKERFWIGKLDNAEIIAAKKSEEIKQVYKRKGWLNEMKSDLEKLEIDSSNLDKWDGGNLFNVRFKPEDFTPYPSGTLISENDNSITSYHYILLHLHKTPSIEDEANSVFRLGDCRPESRSNATTLKKKYEEKYIEYPYLHHQISFALEQVLRKDFDKVFAEHRTGNSTYIDLVAERKGKLSFYEIKTHNNVMTCIRMAIGRLLEYTCYPEQKLAEKIYIVTPHRIKDKRIIKYLTFLRDSMGLPLHYMCFDVDSNSIVQEI